MIGKTFMKALANGRVDLLQILLDILHETGSRYCVIDGFAVNAYAEPVVSLDLDIVVIADDLDKVCKASEAKDLTVKAFEHSVNLSIGGSDLRVQMQTDQRYQAFISRSSQREILGYTMDVAALEDVLQGKIWAYTDTTRRKSKRQKDLSDILRLVETHPQLKELLPKELLSESD